MKLFCKVVLMVMALLILGACGEKVKISQLHFNPDVTKVYQDGEAFDGEAWSDDLKSICLTCEDGIVKCVEVYHANGKLAIRNTNLTDAGEMYDEEGNAVTAEEFVMKFPDIITQLQYMSDHMQFVVEE